MSGEVEGGENPDASCELPVASGGRGRRRRGRPTKYDPKRHPAEAEKWAGRGYSLADVARALRVSRTTLITWRGEHPDFLEGLARGREAATDHVERSLYRRAVGFTYTEVEELERSGTAHVGVRVTAEGQAELFGGELPEGGVEKVVEIPATVVQTKRTRRQVLGDVVAIRLWLTNMRPEQWVEKLDVEHGGEVKAKVDLSGLSVEELVEGIRRLAG